MPQRTSNPQPNRRPARHRDGWLSVPELASELRISPRWAYDLEKLPEFPKGTRIGPGFGYGDGDRVRRWPTDQVVLWAVSREVNAKSRKATADARAALHRLRKLRRQKK